MRVLIACERSGIVRRAFRALGHDAWSCDLAAQDDYDPKNPDTHQHYKSDIFAVLNDCIIGADKWDLLIAHPPCTHLSLSGARWLTDHWVKRKEGDRWHDGRLKREQQKSAIQFFKALDQCAIPRRCLENPMSMASTLYRPKDQVIHPRQFGHSEFKTTWLWLTNLPPLRPTHNIPAPGKGTPKHDEWSKVHRMPPGPDRERARSQTYSGIAAAMAQQWGSLAVNNEAAPETTRSGP